MPYTASAEAGSTIVDVIAARRAGGRYDLTYVVAERRAEGVLTLTTEPPRRHGTILRDTDNPRSREWVVVIPTPDGQDERQYPTLADVLSGEARLIAHMVDARRRARAAFDELRELDDSVE